MPLICLLLLVLIQRLIIGVHAHLAVENNVMEATGLLCNVTMTGQTVIVWINMARKCPIQTVTEVLSVKTVKLSLY